MKLFVQWATKTPGDWVEIDSSEWDSLPTKPEPVGGESIDDEPGWINALNVQGVVFNGYDHYAVENRPADAVVAEVSLLVHAWSDDPDDWRGKEYGTLWSFRTLVRDPDVGERYNTRQFHWVYCQGERYERLKKYGIHKGVVLPWESWLSPELGIIRHGIWLPDELYKNHEKARSRHDWTEWTEGVEESAIWNGRVVE